MGAPVPVANTLVKSTLKPGESTVWTTKAEDPDNFISNIQRPYSDGEGNTGVFTQTVTVSDPIIYGEPTSDDPRVVLTVDPSDPEKVNVSVTSAAS